MQKLQILNPSKKGVILFMQMLSILLNIFSIILFMWMHSWTTPLKIFISFRCKGIVLKYFSSNLNCLIIAVTTAILLILICVFCVYSFHTVVWIPTSHPWRQQSKPEFIQRVNNKELASQMLLRFWGTTDDLKGFGRLCLLLSLRRKIICYILKCIQAYKTTGLQGWVFFVSDIMPNSDIWERGCLRRSINEELLSEIPDCF